MWKYLASMVISAGVIAAAVFLYNHRHQLFRPDFDRTGGTLLVYEIDGNPPEDGLDGLIAALERRFDGRGAAGIVVRGEGERRIAVGVPSGKQHDDQVEMVKRLSPRKGMLELLIAANRMDDEASFSAALAPARGAKLDAPPPPPRNASGGDEFPVKLPGTPEHRYRWAPLSEGVVHGFGLNPVGLSREYPLGTPFERFEGLMQVRKLAGVVDPVVFVLVREPPAGLEVPPNAITSVGTSGGRGRAVVQFRIRPEADDRFHDLIWKNLSVDDGRRQLAILLDGQVLSLQAPFGMSRREMSIVGDFMPSEAADLALLLRGGPLPCRLRSKPVRETTTGKSQ